MKRQFNFVAHPGHLVSLDFNLSVLRCVPAMITGDAATATHDFIGAFCGSSGGDDSAAKGATSGTLHEKWEKYGMGLRMQSFTGQ